MGPAVSNIDDLNVGFDEMNIGDGDNFMEYDLIQMILNQR